MTWTLRPFTTDDYPAIASVGKASFPELSQDAQDLRQYDDQQHQKGYRYGRWVAEQEGRIIAQAEYGQRVGRYHPRKFVVDIWVLPGFQSRGFGSALYRRVLEELAPFDPLSVECNCREDMEHSLRFIRKHGFEERMRTWESAFEPASFDPALFAGRESLPGIEIRSLRELADDPERNRKWFEMISEIRLDVPGTEPPTPLDFGEWIEMELEDPKLLPDGYFIALDQGEYVGLSLLRGGSAEGELRTGLTGVKRSHRGRGIAMALKLRALAYAKVQGYKLVRTYNESNNRPMLAINERLGFVRKPAWVDFVKVFKVE